MSIIPATELDAVNLILRNAGETPVNSLSGSIPLEAAQAQDTLEEVSRALQTSGWYFNTEVSTLTPDVDGFIILPANTLSVATWGNSRGTPVVKRGQYLRNMTPLEVSNVWTAAVTVKLVYGLAYDDLPPSAQNYVTLRAARVFQAREIGDELNLQEDSQEEQRAMAELKADQLRTEPLSLKNTYAVYDAISRVPSGRMSWRS